MDIRHRLYPYPVLSDTTDDYCNSTFEMNVSADKGIREIVLKIKFDLNNQGLLSLISDGLAEYIVHIESSHTSFRTVIASSETQICKHILEHHLNGRVSICGFVVAKKDISQYQNRDWNDDYEDYSFDFHKGSIIAIAGQVNLDITKEVEQLAKIPSIFTICRNASDIDESMKFDIGGEKISITLCEKSFLNYKVIATMPSMLPVFHSMIIIPALIYAFESLKQNSISEFEDQRWFKSIQISLKRHGIELSDETLELIPSYELAQKLLDLPVDRALEAIVTFNTDDEED